MRYLSSRGFNLSTYIRMYVYLMRIISLSTFSLANEYIISDSWNKSRLTILFFARNNHDDEESASHKAHIMKFY